MVSIREMYVDPEGARHVNADNKDHQIEKGQKQGSKSPRPTAEVLSDNFPIHMCSE